MRRLAPTITLLVAIAAAAAGTYRGLTLPINHDVSWLLHVSARVLAGDRLYVDVIEVNPPLIIWLGLPVILLEQVLGGSRTSLYPALVALAAAVSLYACYKLSRGLLPDIHRGSFIVAVAVGLFVMPAVSWGQREHLMLIPAMPYVIACAARARGITPPHPWIIGIAAGVGFAIKPHFLLAPLILEAWMLVRTRVVWIGTAAAAGIVLIYGVATLVLAPEYLPMIGELGDIYSAAGTSSVMDMILQPRSLLIALSLVCAFAPGEGVELRRVLGLAVVAWLIMAVVQGKAFLYAYHFLPGLAGAVMLAALAVAGFASVRQHAAISTMAAVLLATIAVGDVIARPGSTHPRWWYIAHTARAVEGERALVISRDVGHAWPAMTYGGAEWTFAFPSAWPAGTPEGVQLVAAHAVEALQSNPTIVLVTEVERADPLPALLQNEAFRHAWGRYQYAYSIPGFRVYVPR